MGIDSTRPHSSTETMIYLYYIVPFVAQQSAVYADEECTQPKQYEYIYEVIISVLFPIPE